MTARRWQRHRTLLHCLRRDVRGASGQLAVPAALDNWLAESGLSVLADPGFQHHAHTPSLVSSHPYSRLCRNWLRYSSVQCCFTPTETIRTIRDGRPSTTTSTFTQLVSSVSATEGRTAYLCISVSSLTGYRNRPCSLRLFFVFFSIYWAVQ